MFARNAGIRRPLEGPVRLDVTFFTPHDPLDERTGDRDNYLKLVQDALEGFAFVNDRQVCDGTPRKVQDAANPRTEITISKAVL
jgi:Holliday junction resolvase RusA-like endonuclease